MSSYILLAINPKNREIRTKFQYFSQNGYITCGFPKYSGYSNQIVTSPWGFFRKFGETLI